VTITPPPRFALWALGFRPFYLLAAVFASLSVGLWVLQYSGVIQAAALRGAAWHGHEMLFGYAFAVVGGFLFTAVRNWAQRPTPTGATLAAIVALWIAGRVLVLTPYAMAAAAVNALFPLAVAVGIGVPLVAAGNRRNYFFVALLVAASCAVLAFHLAAMGRIDLPPRVGLQVGLDLVLFIVAVVAGRVIPMFTNNGVPGAGATRQLWVERASLGGVLALLALDVAGIAGAPLAVLALAVAAAHAARLWLWRPWRTLGTPLVWVLHAAYAWIVVHLVLRAAAQGGAVAEPLATHALTIGVIGGMTIGMMTRTARGHTGRPLAADGFEVTCYVLVQLAAATRVLGGLAVPSWYLQTAVASGLLWSAAFALYAVRYWPVLSRPRVDGKPG
jgi:uncharacterized protein involved in response to NO